MQDKRTAINKGPGAIAGIRTKGSRFSSGSDSEIAVAPDTFYFYADEDIDIGGSITKRIAVRARKWTRVDGVEKAEVIRLRADQQGIEFIKTRKPPPEDS